MALAPALPLDGLAARQPCAADSLSRFVLNGIPIDQVTLEEASARVMARLTKRSGHDVAGPMLIMGPNSQLITLAAKRPQFAQALRTAGLSVADGISIVLASRWLGQSLPERVTGGDLMERLCIESARHGLSVFFLGGLPGAAERTARKFERLCPGFRTAGFCCPPMGFERDPAANEDILRQIMAAKPDLLCVAFGAPRQEIWMMENCPSLPIGAALSVGAAFDTQAGLRKRAPSWTHAIGCEWLY